MKLDRTVAEVAALLGGCVEGPAERRLACLSPPEQAGADDLAVIFHPGADLDGCDAGCLVLAEGDELRAGPARSLIRVADPEAALDRLAAEFGAVDRGPEPGVQPSAVVAPGAEVDPTAAVGDGVFIGEGARVGAGCVLWPGVCLGRAVVLGAGCVLHFRVVVEARCRLGERVELHAGVVIGADGFGYRRQGPRQLKSPQVGWVELADDVEVGANSTIDRGRLGPTRVGARTKIDDGVHLAHNCQVGADCALAGQVALAGGVTLGNGVLMGGRSGVSDGITVPDGVVVGGCAVVFQEPQAGQYLLGTPARPHREWKRQVLSLARLPAVIARLRRDPPASESPGRDP